MSLFIRTDVTAVKFYRTYILAGIGSSVYIYTKDSYKLITNIKCLNGQKIYGLVPSEISNKILVFGGKQFSVLSLEYSNDEDKCKIVRIIDPIVCHDWLHSIAWITDESIAVLTAHNSVQVWDISKNCIISQHSSDENSILYSGLILPLQDGILVLAGTVFSEIIIHTTAFKTPLHYLKGHRGVIFSISVNLYQGIIVTTSDDRSVRVWSMYLGTSASNIAADTVGYWGRVSIKCIHELYGHTARVMRSCITDKTIISVGEDSAICFWNCEGKLIKKFVTHQNACIWSIDADESHVATGGGDGAVIIHLLKKAFYNGHNEIYNFNMTPKKIAFTARRNLVILDDKDNLVHFNINDNTQTKYKLNHESTFKLFAMSSCKQLVAVADKNGKLDVFAENCKNVANLTNIIDTKLDLGNILSMHWAGNRHLIFCGEQGVITVISSQNNDVETFAAFVLPSCKERWLTSAAIDLANRCVVVGDRCGNIHVYFIGNKNPYKSFGKVHGRYGPTSITIKNRDFITTGRDRTIKYFIINKQDKSLTKFMNSKDLEFQWVEKFIDKDENLVCGFQERTFVVYDIKNHNKALEVICGGGHRSWDVVRYIDVAGYAHKEYIKLVYIKNSDIHSNLFLMSKIMSRNVTNSSHSKEINCLKTFISEVDPLVTFYVTGGEDTTLRISTIDAKLEFQDEIVYKHLSNVRTLKLTEFCNGVLVTSAGGRAQICLTLINITNDDRLKVLSEELVDFMTKGTDKLRRNNQTWRTSTVDFDPETRIMDLDLIKPADDRILIFAGCSDAYLRIFSFTIETFALLEEVKHHTTCILKTVCVKLSERDILITCTTIGEVALWDVTQKFGEEIAPFFSTRTNKSGINSIDTRILSDKELLIATGGDDNALILILIEVPSSFDTHVKYSKCIDKYHCSQITGVKFYKEFLLTTSIDQRVTLLRWCVDDNGISCEFLTQIFSDIADVQGLEVTDTNIDFITVCVYGNGLELLRVPIQDPH